MKERSYNIEEIKRRLDMVSYAAAHFGGTPERSGAEVHLVGAKLGGFRMNTAKGVFRHETEDVGGDVLDLVGYVLFGKAYFASRSRYFADVLAEAGRLTDVEPAERERPHGPQLPASPRAASPAGAVNGASSGIANSRTPDPGAAEHDATATPVLENAHDALEAAPSSNGAVCNDGMPDSDASGRDAWENQAHERETRELEAHKGEPREREHRERERRVLVAVYTYRAADGSFLYEARKYRPRGYSYRRYAADRTPILGIDADDYVLANGVYVRTYGRPAGGAQRFEASDRVLYRLPELRRAVAGGHTIFLVEGEKDVETLAALGIPATTNPMGAGKWLDQFSAELAGADVVVIPDNDEPGRRHAARVTRSLTGVAASVRVLELPGLPPRGDVTDWIENGGTADELLTMADASAYPAEDPALYDDYAAVEDVTGPEPAGADAHQRNERSAYPLLPRDPFTDLSEEDERGLVIPEDVYEHLPSMLKELASFFAPGYERDVFLTGALPVIGGAAVNTVGDHGDGPGPLALYTAVVALTGSGKGVLHHAYNLGRAINRRLIEQSKDARADWQARVKSKDGDPGPEPPERSFYLAGNASKRALIDNLAANNGVGVIFETEIVTIVNTIGQEWGDVYDIFLRALHGEPLSISRKSDGRMYVENPALFITLSGTPAAFARLVPTTEDGLFSRFALYRFESHAQWESKEPGTRHRQRTAAFEQAADRLDLLHRTLTRRSDPLIVGWTHEQWSWLNETFSTALANLVASRADVTLEATIKRLGLMAFRIGCILSALRAFGDDVNIERARSLTVYDADARTGIVLAMLYYRHALRFAATMPRAGGPRLRGRIVSFLDTLPGGVFGRAEYRAAAERNGISERSAQRYLTRLMASGIVADQGYGRYRKNAHAHPHATDSGRDHDTDEPGAEESRRSNSAGTHAAAAVNDSPAVMALHGAVKSDTPDGKVSKCQTSQEDGVKFDRFDNSPPGASGFNAPPDASNTGEPRPEGTEMPAQPPWNARGSAPHPYDDPAGLGDDGRSATARNNEENGSRDGTPFEEWEL
ncbi:MAG: DUF3987 domain-containing protein [Bacteroidetes bacterium]|nr:DUF3987 domain-containing protein [Bacteroidota bacterium]